MQGKKVLVIGLGISGQSAVRFLLKNGAEVWGEDENPAWVDKYGLQKIGLRIGQERTTEPFDLCVVSPGVPPTSPSLLKVIERETEVIGEVELAFRSIKNPLVAVTGTNGKTTVSYLLSHLLKANGIPSVVLGNAGVPVTSALDHLEDEVLICELSSFQLERLQSRAIDIGVILNITPDHLDRYSSFEEYALAKIKIADCLKPGGTLYVEEHTFEEFRFPCQPKLYGSSSRCHVYLKDRTLFFKEKNKRYTLPVHDRNWSQHDCKNVLAALALALEMGSTMKTSVDALKTFQKLPHRIEFVKKIDSVAYYNDSKGTNVDAVVCAVGAMKGKVLLIAGGMDKGSNFRPWIDLFGHSVRVIYAMGQTADKIKRQLSQAIDVVVCLNLDDAFQRARKEAKSGENVLLSPGCSSFDMFDNYQHRGDTFKQLVNAIRSESS